MVCFRSYSKSKFFIPDQAEEAEVAAFRATEEEEAAVTTEIRAAVSEAAIVAAVRLAAVAVRSVAGEVAVASRPDLDCNGIFGRSSERLFSQTAL